MLWHLEPRAPGRADRLPPRVRRRLRACRAAGVPFTHWVYAQEVAPPAVAARPVRGGRVRGLWALLGAGLGRLRRLDPVVIGVIGVGADRGIWVCCGRWSH